MSILVSKNKLINIVPFVLLSLGLLIFLLACRHFYHATADDLYISFRYARNFANGDGLVFNIGDKIEGYSNFLWVIILAVLSKLNLSLPIFSKYLSIIFGALSIYCVFLISNLYQNNSITFFKHSEANNSNEFKMHYIILSSLVVSFLFAISYPFVYWSATGMETTFFTSLILASLIIQHYDLKSSSIFPKASIIFVLLSLCRVEGIVFYLFSIPAKIFLIKSKRNHFNKLYFKKYFMEFCIIISSFIIFELWRFYYYQDIISNTYYAKYGGMQWILGFKYMWAFVSKYYLLLLLAGGSVFILKNSNTFLKHLMIAYLVGYIGLIIFIGGDWMWHFRYFIPLIAMFWILSSSCFAKMIQIIANYNIKYFFKVGITIILVLLIGFIFKNTIIQNTNTWKNVLSLKTKKSSFCIEALIVNAHKSIAHYLNQNIPANSTLAANHIGSLGYYSQFTILDMVGLINPEVAKQFNMRFHEKYHVDNLLEKKPDYVLLTTRTKPQKDEFISDYWIGETALYNHPTFQKHYFKWDETRQYTFAGQTEYLVVFERK